MKQIIIVFTLLFVTCKNTKKENIEIKDNGHTYSIEIEHSIDKNKYILYEGPNGKEKEFENLYTLKIEKNKKEISKKIISKAMLEKLIDEKYYNQISIIHFDYYKIQSDTIFFNLSLCVPETDNCIYYIIKTKDNILIIEESSDEQYDYINMDKIDDNAGKAPK